MSYDPNQPQQPDSGQQPQPPYGQPGQSQQPPYEQPQQPPYEQQWGQQPPQNYAPTQYVAPAYVLGIIGGLIVLSCAACGILFALGAGPLVNIVGSIAGPAYTVNQYYNAVEKQDYTTAFSYISTNSTVLNGQISTQDLYTSAAQAVDAAKGKVTSISIGNISLTNNNNTAIVTVTVTRSSTPAYVVHLQLQQVNGSWKIVSLDNI